VPISLLFYFLYVVLHMFYFTFYLFIYF
jgi:hypothetical protein